MKILLFALVCYSVNAFAQSEEGAVVTDNAPKVEEQKKVQLDPKVLSFNDPKRIDSLFKNMIVIQKKAIERKNKWVFDTHLSFDFSDNPKTMYATAFGLGYAFAENFEFGLSFAPYIVAIERSSVKAVRSLVLANNTVADLYSPDPKWEAAVNLTWAFAYGKDAFGPYSIIRSDTFLKFFYSKVKYEGELNGSRMALFVGKTFFISKALNFRFAAGFSRQTYYVNQKSQTSNIGLIEPGLVWFL